MLEWTICKNCGKIIDNSKNTCSFCGSDVDKIQMDYLTNYLAESMFIIKTLDVFKPRKMFLRSTDFY